MSVTTPQERIFLLIYIPDVPVVLVLSILLILVFLVWERHLETHTSFPPIVKFSLFTRHSYMITAVVLGAFFNSASVYGFIYVMTIFYQNYKGLNALENAVRWLPACIIGLVAAVRFPAARKFPS